MQITLPKITPGEWEIVGELDNLRVMWMNSGTPESCDGTEQIAHVVCGDFELTHYDKPEANARAIAALPDLLAALADLLMNLNETGLATMPGDVFANMRETTERARAALSKAGCTIED